MPLQAQKQYENGYPIKLYGKENDAAKQIYDTLPLDSQNGNTDILALENKIIMMVRDRGHALSIEIEFDNEIDVYVKYFIPKICNVKMINSLVRYGIQLVKDTSIGTTGIFRTTKQQLAQHLCNFIELVPMDSDMELNMHTY